MAGSKGERAIAKFAQNNKKALIKALRIGRKEIPSRYVIKGIIKNIDFSELQNIFYHQNFTSLVSVFAGKRKQVLAAGKIETKKENEIPKVQELIAMLDLKDATFTLDALHCREKTVNIIKNTGNHYIIGVKNNQKKLYQDIKKMQKA